VPRPTRKIKRSTLGISHNNTFDSPDLVLSQASRDSQDFIDPYHKKARKSTYVQDDYDDYSIDSETGKTKVKLVQYKKDKRGSLILDKNGRKIPVTKFRDGRDASSESSEYDTDYEVDSRGDIKLDRHGEPIPKFVRDPKTNQTKLDK